MTKTDVEHHHHSFFREWREGVGEDKESQGGEAAEAVEERPEVVPGEALPWVDLEPSVTADNPVVGVYLSYLVDRPDSVVGALRDVAGAEGAALVHCAAGKDRTGTLVALVLETVGVQREAVVEDYALSAERIDALFRKWAAASGEEMPSAEELDRHRPRADAMARVLAVLDERDGGAAAWLQANGLTDSELAALRAKFL
jgi:hypothetical protein